MENDDTVKMLPSNDHDLLIKVSTLQERTSLDMRDLHTTIGGLTNSITQLITSFEAKITEAIRPKIDRAEVEKMRDDSTKIHEDIEQRVRFIERYMWAAIGIVGVLELIFKAIK